MMEKNKFWYGFHNTLGLEYQEISELKGKSGITHHITSLGIDRKNKKLVIVQNEQDARILAMAQADIQARYSDYNVLMVRPVPLNLSNVFEHLSVLLGENKLSLKTLSGSDQSQQGVDISEHFQENIHSTLEAVAPQLFKVIEETSLSTVPIFKEVVQQLSHLKYIQKIENIDNQEFNILDIDFKELLNFNPLIYDTNAGVCPIPFYSFSENEVESFIDNKTIENNIEILKKYNIHQFFNPPPDALALGLIESGNKNELDILKTINTVPRIGHPLSQNEVIEQTKIPELVDALKDKGLAVEGEFGVEISETGIQHRAVVRFSPRESIFKRISNLISFNVDLNSKDLKDLFK